MRLKEAPQQQGLRNILANARPSAMEKIAVDSSVHDVHLRANSPRSTLAWKDYWGYDSTSPDSTTSLQDESPFDAPKSPPQRPLACRSLNLASPVPSSVVAEHQSRSVPTSPVIQDDRALEVSGPDEGHGPRGLEASDRWELVWRSQSRRTSSPNNHESQHHEIICADQPGEDSWSVGSSPAEEDRAGSKPSQQDRAYFNELLNEELTSLKSCAKRAIDLGKMVQECAAVEAVQLRVDIGQLEVTAQKYAKLNDDLEYQLFDLRNENQQLELEREAMLHEQQIMKRERDGLLAAIRDAKSDRKREETEKDAVLGALLEERLKGATERETMTSTIRALRKKLESADRDRIVAVKALRDARDNLGVEREAMLMAVHELKTRLEFDNDARMSSMRRSSLDACVANMYSGKRSNRKSFSEKRN